MSVDSEERGMFAAVLVAIFPAEIFPICDRDYSSRGLQW
jgi:hypothetical protein